MRCTQCGKDNADDLKHCFYCGSELFDEPTDPINQEGTIIEDLSNSELSNQKTQTRKKAKSSRKAIVIISIIVVVGIIGGVIFLLSAQPSNPKKNEIVYSNIDADNINNSQSYNNTDIGEDSQESNDIDQETAQLEAKVEYTTKKEIKDASYFYKASASSVLPDQEGHNYSALNVLRDDGTCWCEAASGYGEGEWIRLELPEVQRLSGLRIINGYAGTQKQYDYNSKISKVRIEFSDGSSITVDLKVFDSSQRKTVQNVSFSKPIETEFVKLTIVSVVAGDCPDTCLTFVEPF